MTIQEFKAMYGNPVLNFYKSNTTERYIASFTYNGKEERVITRSDFDPNKPEKYVYRNNILVANEETGEMVDCFWLGNKAPKEAAFSL